MIYMTATTGSRNMKLNKGSKTTFNQKQRRVNRLHIGLVALLFALSSCVVEVLLFIND